MTTVYDTIQSILENEIDDIMAIEYCSQDKTWLRFGQPPPLSVKRKRMLCRYILEKTGWSVVWTSPSEVFMVRIR